MTTPDGIKRWDSFLHTSYAPGYRDASISLRTSDGKEIELNLAKADVIRLHADLTHVLEVATRSPDGPIDNRG